MRISILGAGAWGTALAMAAAPRHQVLLWGRDATQIQHITADRSNRRYLPGVRLPESLGLTADRIAALKHGDDGLILIATPLAGLREQLQAVPEQALVLWLCKGFELGHALLGHEIAAQVRPGLRCGVLSGPSFALEVARGQPTALVAASESAELRERTVDAFHAEGLRIYTTDDVIGVEVGGAVKNVLAIATGMADGLALGPNARAALITRGLAEMTRLGVALGARAETFMGLSGVGDLVLSATGDLSRNRQVGLRLAVDQPMADILRQIGHVAEGVPAARMVAQRAAELGVPMPVTAALVSVLDGRLSAAEAVESLLRRDARTEH